VCCTRTAQSKLDATYIFKHALVRDAAYAMLSRSKRQQVHRRISDALEKNFPNTIETRPELLAHHLEQGLERARANEGGNTAFASNRRPIHKRIRYD
jgi:predicted ATPase